MNKIASKALGIVTYPLCWVAANIVGWLWCRKDKK